MRLNYVWLPSLDAAATKTIIIMCFKQVSFWVIYTWKNYVCREQQLQTRQSTWWRQAWNAGMSMTWWKHDKAQLHASRCLISGNALLRSSRHCCKLAWRHRALCLRCTLINLAGLYVLNEQVNNYSITVRHIGNLEFFIMHVEQTNDDNWLWAAPKGHKTSKREHKQ